MTQDLPFLVPVAANILHHRCGATQQLEKKAEEEKERKRTCVRECGAREYEGQRAREIEREKESEERARESERERHIARGGSVDAESSGDVILLCVCTDTMRSCGGRA